MPIDPNVLTPTLIKPISVAGVVHDAAVVQEAQARAQAYRDKQMEVARDRQENEQIRGILQQSAGQLDDQTFAAIRQVSVPKAMDIEKLHNDSVKSSFEIDNSKIDHDLKVLGYISRQLAGITDQHSYDMARAGIKATTGQDLPEQYDPALVQSWQEKGMTYAEKLGQQREDRAAKYQELTAARQQSAEERAQSREERMAAAQQQQLGMEGQRLGLERQRVGLEAKRVAQWAAGHGPAGAEIEIKPNTRDYRLATDLATGRLPFADFQRMFGRGAQFAERKAAMYDTARQLNPNFDPAAYEAGLKVASNPKVVMQVASLNNVMSGIPDLLAASNAADSAGLRILNSYIHKGGFTVGGKAYSNLATARTAFADELSGALGYGSATDMSREMGFNMTDTTLPPDKFAAAIQDVVVPFVNRKKASILGGMGVYGEPGRSPASAKVPDGTVKIGRFTVRPK